MAFNEKSETRFERAWCIPAYGYGHTRFCRCCHIGHHYYLYRFYNHRYYNQPNNCRHYLTLYMEVTEGKSLSFIGCCSENIDIKTIEQILTQAPGIEGWHHLHIWAVSTTENAATVHIVISNLLQMEEIKWNLKNELRKRVFSTRLSNVKLPTLYVKTEIAAEYFFQFTSVYIRIRHKAHINSFTYQGLIDYTHQQTNQTRSQHYQS